MAKYIKIDKNTFPTPYNINVSDYARGWNACLNSVLQHKTANVVEVRHGEWIEHHGQSYLVHPMKYDEYGPILQDYVYYECSECGRTENKKEPYCNCGAKMDGKEVI